MACESSTGPQKRPRPNASAGGNSGPVDSAPAPTPAKKLPALESSNDPKNPTGSYLYGAGHGTKKSTPTGGYLYGSGHGNISTKTNKFSSRSEHHQYQQRKYAMHHPHARAYPHPPISAHTYTYPPALQPSARNPQSLAHAYTHTSQSHTSAEPSQLPAHQAATQIFKPSPLVTKNYHLPATTPAHGYGQPPLHGGIMQHPPTTEQPPQQDLASRAPHPYTHTPHPYGYPYFHGAANPAAPHSTQAPPPGSGTASNSTTPLHGYAQPCAAHAEVPRPFGEQQQQAHAPVMDPATYAAWYAQYMAGVSTPKAEAPAKDCPVFLRKGFCPDSNKCPFNHPQLMYYPRRPNKPVCSFYRRHGRCDFGKACRFDHPPLLE